MCVVIGGFIHEVFPFVIGQCISGILCRTPSREAVEYARSKTVRFAEAYPAEYVQ